MCGGRVGEKEVVVAELKPHLAGRGTIIFRSDCCAPHAPRAQSAVRGRAAAGERTFVDIGGNNRVNTRRQALTVLRRKVELVCYQKKRMLR